MKEMGGRVHVGTSGWAYKSWSGDFYPADLPTANQLAFIGEHFTTVEINASFYSLRRPASFERWRRETPSGFVFAVKGGRYITHVKRLRDADVALANFFASGVLALDDKLGPLLWQLPPTLQFDEEALRGFLGSLPRDTDEAKRLAAFHSAVVEGRTWLEDSPRHRLRHALEVRHESFRSPACRALLRTQGVALVVADSAGSWPMIEETTTDFVYVRLHGHEKLYSGGYSDKVLSAWVDKIQGWAAADQDVYIYFDNDIDGRAPFDAERLRELLDQSGS